ncbi:hypothetical protein I4U23_027058 [Adineta vaga]|nr:hypothetical protein I4U23_027058 [Adineta vaga]
MRTIRARLYHQSIYSHSFHRHYLGKYPSNSMKNCLFQCQNHNYCRTATYQSTEQQCYLYEEYSYVGTIVSSSDNSIVIALHLCPDDEMKREPDYLCLPSKGQSIPMQTVMNGLQLVKQYLNINTVGFVLSVDEAWLAPVGASSINVYSLKNYSIIRSVSTNKAFGYFDLDSQMKPIIANGGQGLYFQSLNKTLNNGIGFWTPCISVTGFVIGIVYSPSNLLNIYNQTSGTYLYSINGSINTFNSISYRKYACTIYDNNLYFGSNNSIQQVSIEPSNGIKIIKTILNFTNTNPSFITSDASKRLYSSCSDCLSFNKTFILTTNGTILAQWPQKLAFTQGKASKSKFYFVTSTDTNILSFYEYS